MVNRTSQAELDDLATTALTDALADIGADPEMGLTAIGAAKLTSTLGPRLIERAQPTRPASHVIVADSISETVRHELDDAGINWLDRRGHLRIDAPGVFIDTDISPLPRRSDQTRAVIDRPIRGRGGLAVAVDALCRTAAGEPLSTGSEVARRAALSQPTISVAARALRDAALLGDNGATIPDLFWETAGVWRPEWVDLHGLPQPPDSLELTAGGTRAAIQHDIGLVVNSNYPWELYAPDRATVSVLRWRHADSDGPVVARVAAAPTPLALEDHIVVDDAPFGFVHPIIAALDAASDPSRGAEAVRAWNPEHLRRVW